MGSEGPEAGRPSALREQGKSLLVSGEDWPGLASASSIAYPLDRCIQIDSTQPEASVIHAPSGTSRAGSQHLWPKVAGVTQQETRGWMMNRFPGRKCQATIGERSRLSKVCGQVTIETIVSEGIDKGELRKVCTEPPARYVTPSRVRKVADDPKEKAQEERQRREAAIASTTGIQTLAPSPKPFMKRLNAGNPAVLRYPRSILGFAHGLQVAS